MNNVIHNTSNLTPVDSVSQREGSVEALLKEQKDVFEELFNTEMGEMDFHDLKSSPAISPTISAAFSTEKRGLLNQNIQDLSDDSTDGISSRLKTSLRMQYEAQAKVIERQLGGIESVRLKLGLSQRKICQLLMVDPSAWSRWLKTSAVPPHILRALQWYLIIQEKIPGLTPLYFIGKDPEVLHRVAMGRIEEEKKIREQFVENVFGHTMKLEEEIRDLKAENEALKKGLEIEQQSAALFRKKGFRIIATIGVFFMALCFWILSALRF